MSDQVMHGPSDRSSAGANQPATSEGKGDDIVDSDKPDPELFHSSNELTGLRLLVLHTALCLCTFLVGLDFNLLATAIPRITSEFHSIEDVGWYGGAFYIALCASQPLAGKSYILFPKKIVYISCIALFEAGSLVCALAPRSSVLITGRAIAGFGASGIFAGGLVIVTTVIPLHKRAVWQGVINSTFAIASIVGPVIGGGLTQHVTWRWCFYINLPVGGFSIAMIMVFLKLRPAATEQVPLSQKLKNLDAVGFALFGGAVTMFLLALQWGGTTYPWRSSVIIGLFIGFGLTIITFVIWQWKLQDTALVPPRIFQHRNLTLVVVAAVFANGPFQTVVYWLPIWFQAILGSSPTISGVQYLPTVISDVLTSIIGSGIVMKLGTWNPFHLLGSACMAVGSGLLTTLHPGSTTEHWIGFQILGGIGYSLVINMAHLGIQASLPADILPVGVTTLLFGMTFSCATSLAIGQAVFQSQLTRSLKDVVSSDAAADILSIGATNLRTEVIPQQLSSVLQAYNDTVTKIFFVPAVAPVISFLAICFARWTSIKKNEDDIKSSKEKSLDV